MMNGVRNNVCRLTFILIELKKKKNMRIKKGKDSINKLFFKRYWKDHGV